MSISTCTDYPFQQSCVGTDFRPAFVTDAINYSSVGDQDMALKVPLGSQLNLLSSETAGNPYIDYKRLYNRRLGSLENVMQGYSFGPLAGGSYQPFGSAYGKW